MRAFLFLACLPQLQLLSKSPVSKWPFLFGEAQPNVRRIRWINTAEMDFPAIIIVDCVIVVPFWRFPSMNISLIWFCMPGFRGRLTSTREVPALDGRGA